VATLIAKNANEAVVAPMAGSGGVCVWQKFESGGRLFVDAFGSNMFSRLTFLVKKFYKYLISMRFAKTMLEYYCWTQKKMFIPNNFDGYTSTCIMQTHNYFHLLAL
jgi:hypothetical protein